MPTPITAASAYANVARLTNDPTLMLGRQASAGPANDTSFASVLNNAIGAVNDMRGVIGSSAVAPAKDASFATVLKDAIGAVSEMGQKSDAQTRAAVNGKADMVNVVTAVSETSVAINAVVAVRDRVIQAYDDIMKMPI